jgi:hypothetical protein
MEETPHGQKIGHCPTFIELCRDWWQQAKLLATLFQTSLAVQLRRIVSHYAE